MVIGFLAHKATKVISIARVLYNMRAIEKRISKMSKEYLNARNGVLARQALKHDTEIRQALPSRYVQDMFINHFTLFGRYIYSNLYIDYYYHTIWVWYINAVWALGILQIEYMWQRTQFLM